MSACVLFQNTKMWDGEITHPVDWHVHRDNCEHLELGDCIFLSRRFSGRFRRQGGIFAAGTIVEPLPGSKIIFPSTVVFERKFMDGQITPHVNVRVDIPPLPIESANPPKCSHDYPILLPELELAKRTNGTKIPPNISVEDLRESLWKAWESAHGK